MSVKAVYIVTNDDWMAHDADGLVKEFKSERAALKAAGERLADTEGQEAEVWVWKLTHVATKPPIEPVIDVAE